MLSGIPCLVGYHASWDTILSGIPCLVGYHGKWDRAAHDSQSATPCPVCANFPPADFTRNAMHTLTHSLTHACVRTDAHMAPLADDAADRRRPAATWHADATWRDGGDAPL